MKFSVMTFNVRGSFHQDGVNDWQNRRDLNIATLLKYAPDIIGFQEAQSGNLEAYQEALSDYDVELGLISIRKAENYHRVPIYWKRDRFTKAASGAFYLSQTPSEWSMSWGSTLVRAATWVNLRERGTDGEVVVLNTHFPHEPESDAARLASAQLVIRELRQAASPTIPRIVMADFNAVPTSATYETFREEGYQDATTGAHETNTFHGFQGKSFPYSRFCIDWILVKNGDQRFSVNGCTVVMDADPPLYPSDHYPVLADLELL